MMYTVASQEGDADLVANEHLLVLGTDASGKAAVFVSGRWGSYDHANYPFTSSGRVSPACSASERSSRCRKLPIVRSDRNLYIVLAPLQDAVGLMELRYDGRELFRVRDTALSITSAFDIDDCVPLDIISFEDRLIVLCLENFRTLRSCNIDIDQDDISRSVLSQCVSLYTLGYPADFRYVSNFVLYEDQVVFASSGVIYGIRFDRFDARLYSSLNDVTCDRLQYAGDHMFYAYCASGQTLLYNTDTLRVENTGLLVPFVCPQSDETLFKVQQANQDTVVRYNDRMNYRTSGVNFTVGECYDTDLFLLLDSVKGTEVFRQSSRSFQLFSNSSRDRNFEVFDGPYVVVYRTDPGETALYDPSFTRVAGISLETAASAAVIADLSVLIPTPSPTQNITPLLPAKDPTENDVWYASKGGIAFWFALVTIIIVAALVVVVVGVFLYR